MSMLNIFNVSGSAVSAQSQRLNTVATNLANADTVAGPDGQSFKARQVLFQTLAMGDSGDVAACTTPSIQPPMAMATSPTATSTRWRRWST